MTPEQLKDIRWFKSAPVQSNFAPEQIDAENGIIRDVVMLQEGPAKGHGVWLESEFVKNIIAYDKRYFSKTGLKARFGHPGASDNTMGSQLGYFSNFRTREVEMQVTENDTTTTQTALQGIADLQLLDASALSPTNPGMREWVLQMAQEAPDFIMSSIVFNGSGYYQRKKGKKVMLEFDEWGDPINYDESLGHVYVEFDPAKAKHHYTDLVEAGAATDTLFSDTANPHLFVAQAREFLNEHPKLKQFVAGNPDKVKAFLVELGLNFETQKPVKMGILKDLLFGDKKEIAEDVILKAEDIEALRTSLSTAETAVEKLTKDFNALSTEVGDLKKSLAAKDEEITALKAKIPAAKHTEGAEEEDEAKEEAWGNDEITRKAKVQFAARRKRTPDKK